MDLNPSQLEAGKDVCVSFAGRSRTMAVKRVRGSSVFVMFQHRHPFGLPLTHCGDGWYIDGEKNIRVRVTEPGDVPSGLYPGGAGDEGY